MYNKSKRDSTVKNTDDKKTSVFAIMNRIREFDSL